MGGRHSSQHCGTREACACDMQRLIRPHSSVSPEQLLHVPLCSMFFLLVVKNIKYMHVLYTYIYISLFLVRVTGIIPQPALGCWVWYLDSVNTRWATFVSRLQTSLGSPLPVSCEIIDCVSFDEPTHIKSHMCRHNFPPRRLWLPDGSLIPSDASRCLQMPPRCIQMPK